MRVAIRLREVSGKWIAVCAARSMPKPGDIYLHDGLHHALTIKFEADFAEMGMLQASSIEPEIALMQKEESDNSNRTWWDSVYGQR